MFGSTSFNPPSRFLGEIPGELLRAIDESESVGGSDGSVSPIRDAVHGVRELPQVAPGDTVEHDKWGEGVVLAVNGSGTDAEVTIRFDDAGEKRLLLAYAPLKRVG